MIYVCNRTFSLMHNYREILVHVGDKYQIIGQDAEHIYFSPVGLPWKSYVVRTEFFKNHFKAQEDKKE